MRPVGLRGMVARGLRAGVVIVAVISALLLSPQVAAADSPTDYGYTGGDDPIRFPDSRDHGHCLENLDPDFRDRASWALGMLTDSTDMTPYSSLTCGTTYAPLHRGLINAYV